jgi:stage III sporulation protein SpoIIIAA
MRQEASEILIELLPTQISEWIYTEYSDRIDSIQEIIIDLGREPELRLTSNEYAVMDDYFVTSTDISSLELALSEPFSNNRIGIPETLHRVSVIKSRDNRPIGYTLRVGRHIDECSKIIYDLLDSNDSVLLIGKPGVGKSSKLRDACYYLSMKGYKVMIVDTSNEIAGDCEVPHEAVGRARRLMVGHHKQQAEVMIEAVENHTPNVVVIDEISNWAEAKAARTIAQRGVKLIATVHGEILENVINNPDVCSLVGGAKSVTLSDGESVKQNKPKMVVQREHEPVFTKVVELQSFTSVSVHHNVKDAVDNYLRGNDMRPEKRTVDQNGEVVITSPEIITDMGNKLKSLPKIAN